MKNFWEEIKRPILALAPMAGITDSAFRTIARKYGASVTYSEMASASALFFKPEKTLHLLDFKKAEKPYVVQLFGKNPEHFARATKLVSEKIKPDGIDINFGCPAKKVFSHGSGCALMLDSKLSREIIQAVIKNTSLPVSIKIRAGVKDVTALDFVENIKNLDWKAIMVHGRTYEEKFAGEADFKIIEKIKALVPNKLVLANGGITTPEEGAKILIQYPTFDGIGIARGALGRPWIFQEIKDLLGRHCEESHSFKKKNEKTWQSRDCFATLAMTKKIALEHAALIVKTKNDRGILEIRKHLIWYFKGFSGAKEMRQKLVQAQNLSEIKKILENTPT